MKRLPHKSKLKNLTDKVSQLHKSLLIEGGKEKDKKRQRYHMERESTKVQITQKQDEKEETLTKKMKRSPDGRHTKIRKLN